MIIKVLLGETEQVQRRVMLGRGGVLPYPVSQHELRIKRPVSIVG